MDWCGLTCEELRAWASDEGLPAYRGQQLFEALHHGGAEGFADLKTWPQALRARLAEAGPLVPGGEDRRQESRDGTVKSLLSLHSGGTVECVSIPPVPEKCLSTRRRRKGEGVSASEEAEETEEGRHTVCVSSQVGCAVGCPFCASGAEGLVRDCTAGEIVLQVLHHQRRRAVNNVVWMGAGEPLFNLDAVLHALRVLVEPRGLGLGRRRFTVSTAGVPEGIRRLAAEEPQVTLALSLHAAADGLRDRLVPLNRRWPLTEVLAAVAAHAERTGRRPTFEYVLLAGTNDGAADARALADLARTHRAHVNLIAWNAVPDAPYPATPRRLAVDFRDRVAAAGANVTLRASRGADIAAACGQLRATHHREAPAP